MAKLAVAAVLLLVPVAGAASPPPFTAKVARVTAPDLPYSWRPGCPVGPARLRAVRLRHWDFRGRSRVGVLVVDRAVVPDVVSVFRRLYAARFPIRRMLGVEVYRGSDDASMRADNTSAFNCRYVEGTNRWSEHAYGRAIDVNTVENPYVHGGLVEPAAGRAYLDRSRRRPGMAVESGVLVRAFEAVGWGWGGRWRSAKDYQHFSTSGR
ncbi:MAG TPA: M15 family metallopeptidase [Gaiellaceae bacterium]|nr:M15 family metallopeptidase [Gaiellaceae bacterium]